MDKSKMTEFEQRVKEYKEDLLRREAQLSKNIREDTKELEHVQNELRKFNNVING